MSQIFVYGNSYKSCIVGIIVPEETVLFEWARDNNLELNLKKLCSNPDVKKLILKDLEQQAKAGDLKGFEKVRYNLNFLILFLLIAYLIFKNGQKVKDIYLHDELFSVENGLLTPTMKSKRTELQNRFQNELNSMNSRLD